MRRLTDVIEDLAPGAKAPIDQCPFDQLIQGAAIIRHVLGLAADGFLPRQAQPSQVLKDRRLIFGAAARGVDVLDAQKEASARRPGRTMGA